MPEQTDPQPEHMAPPWVHMMQALADQAEHDLAEREASSG